MSMNLDTQVGSIPKNIPLEVRAVIRHIWSSGGNASWRSCNTGTRCALVHEGRSYGSIDIVVCLFLCSTKIALLQAGALKMSNILLRITGSYPADGRIWTKEQSRMTYYLIAWTTSSISGATNLATSWSKSEFSDDEFDSRKSLTVLPRAPLLFSIVELLTWTCRSCLTRGSESVHYVHAGY